MTLFLLVGHAVALLHGQVSQGTRGVHQAESDAFEEVIALGNEYVARQEGLPEWAGVYRYGDGLGMNVALWIASNEGADGGPGPIGAEYPLDAGAKRGGAVGMHDRMGAEA